MGERTARTKRALRGVLVSIACLGGAAVAVVDGIAPEEGGIAEGVIVEGHRVREEQTIRALVREHAARWLDEEIWLEAGPLTERLRRVEIGYAIDEDACARGLLSIGRSGNLIEDLATWVRARAGRVEASLVFSLDREVVYAALASVAGRYDRAAVGAEIDEAGRLVAPAEAGRTLDVHASAERVLAGLEAGERRIALVVRSEPPPLDPERLARAREPVVVGSYLTRYRLRGDEGPRAVNVRVAAEALDGAVIPPGGSLSFNERVGPRTPERGYRAAHVIYDGEMVDGIGGGVCQVASTLHAAAFLAGLPIERHAPHSRPSTYIPMGLDATVVYPEVDLVVGNPLATPITVRARAEAGRLEVSLWARAQPMEVEWRREIVARTSQGERTIEDPAVPPGEMRVTEDGGPGFILERTRTLRSRLGAITERATLRYPPTDRVVRVAPGFALAGAEPRSDSPSGATR